MWETRPVQITLRLPHDIADQAEDVQKTDPEFLSRVVLYGLTRRSIYHQLRERSVGPIDCERVELGDGAAYVCKADDVRPLPEDEQRAILAENTHQGGADAG